MIIDKRTNYRMQSIESRFEMQVEKDPDKVAVICKNESITFKDLNTKSNHLANVLRKRGVERNTIVGVMTTRSIDMIIALLGIMKAGGVFLPLAIELPRARLDYMLENCKCAYIIGNSEKLEEFRAYYETISLEKIIWDNDSSKINYSNAYEDLAYVLYTSGSTGKPKGVMIEHKALICFEKSIDMCIDFSQYNRVLALTSISFDIFLLETLIPLIHGCCIVIASEEEQDSPRLIEELIVKHDIDLLQMTPSRMQLLINHKKSISCLQNVKAILIGGDVLLNSVLHKLSVLRNTKIYNLYGPTETCIWATISKLNGKKSVDIGKPLPMYDIYIVDEHNKLCENNVKGEICIAGDILARGYINDEQLTEEKFVSNPFRRGERMYRTGDLAEWNVDGSIRFCGRIDGQIKINGYRIEPCEIESVLSKYDGITQAVVVQLEDKEGFPFLGCFICKSRFIDIKELKKYLLLYLPQYMVPNYYQFLDKIPQTFNGKIDRNYVKMLYQEKDRNLQSDLFFHEKNKDIIDKLLKVIKSCYEEPYSKEINIKTCFEELQFNSLSFVRLVVEIENVFEISFEDEYLDYHKFDSAESLVSYIIQKVDERKIEELEED